MEIKKDVVVLYIGENEAFPKHCDWKKRIGVVKLSYIHSVAVEFIRESRNIFMINLIPLFEISPDCENRANPQYVIDVFGEQIIESLVANLLLLPEKELKDMVRTAQEVCEQTATP